MKRLLLKKIRRVLFAFSGLLFIISCNSNNLSRGNAKEIISKAFKLPLPQTEYFYKYYTKHDHFFNSNNEINRRGESMLDSFENKGLITLSRDTTYEIDAWNRSRPIVGITVNLTEEGKKYLINNNNNKYIIKTNEINIDDITGIQTSEQLQSATVEYSIKRINWTPFGKYYKAIGGFKYLDVTPAKIILKKYDDGWRLSDEDLREIQKINAQNNN